VPGDLTVTNAAVTMSTTANRIAASSNVTFNGYGRMTLANYTSATTQTLASLKFNNDGGNADPALIYGTPTALSTIILSATNAIISTNNSLSFTPSITTSAAGFSALQFSATSPVITVNDGLAATGLNIVVPITQHASMTSLTKAGVGTLALSAANTFSSPFTVSEGSILLGVDTVGSGPITSGPVGTGTLTLANNTALLSNAETRVISNLVVAQGNFTFGGINQLNNVTLSGNVTLSSATATISVPSPAVTATLNGIITTSAPLGGTGLTKTGNGTLVFGASSSLVLNAGAGLRVSGGIVKAGKAQQVTGASLLTVDALAGYDLNGFDHTLNQIAGGGFITNSAASTRTLTLGDATDYAFDGILADNFAGSTSSKLNLTKVGSGILTMTGGNIHNGGTTITAGTIKVSGSGLIGSGAVSVASGSVIDFARAGTYTLPNDFTGLGDMNVTGAGGVAKLLGSAATTNIKITGGTLQVGDGGSVGSIAGTGILKIGVGATLKFNRTGIFTLNRALQDNVGGQLSGFIVQDGPGKTILTADNSSFTGDVRVSNGVLEAAGVNTLVNVRQITVDTLGTLLVSSDDALGFGPGPNVILNGGTMNLLATSVISAFGPVNNLTLSGGIISSGTTDSNSTNSLFVTGAVSVTENSTISAQKVGFVNWVGTSPSFVATDITVATGKTLTVSGTIADDAFSNASSFNKKGLGKMVLSGNNSGMSGQVTVSEGTVVANHANALGNGATDVNSGLVNAVTIASTGHVASNAAIFSAPAPIATSITVNSGGYLGVGDAAIGNLKTSSLKLNGGAFVEFKIWDRMQGAGVGYDKLDLGAMDLSGASSANRIKIKLISMSSATALGNAVNFAPLSFGTFDFGTYNPSGLSGVSGNISDVFTFDTSDFKYTGGAGSNSGLWSISFNAGAVTLTSVPEPSTYGFGLGVLALAAAAIRRRKRQEKKA
jgi:autotransporter-associated beta strand protein